MAHQNAVYQVGSADAEYEKFKFIKELDLDRRDIRIVENGLQVSLESRSKDAETDRNSVIEEFVQLEYDKIADE